MYDDTYHQAAEAASEFLEDPPSEFPDGWLVAGLFVAGWIGALALFFAVA